jgi:hypothetical protein
MKKINQLIIAICFSALALVGSANNTDKNSTAKSETNQIQSYLNNLDYRKFIQASTDLQVHFIISDQNEIVVVSTNNIELDAYIKNNLNYKSVQTTSLSHNTTYILPVHIVIKD